MALSRHERTKHKIDPNPLEMIEKVVQANDWPFDRTSEKEIAVEVAGRWCDYRMFFSWRDDVEALALHLRLRRPHPVRAAFRHPRPAWP